MQPIKFEEYRKKVTEALDKRLKMPGGPFMGESGYTLIDGFFNQPFQKEMSSNFVIGGPALPMVAIVGNTTGRVYFFALKVLVPDIKLI
jgi:hypothetical protein